MKLCVAQPIFAPNKTLLEKSINSIKSLINITNCDFYFSGWVKETKYWDKLDEVILPLNPKRYIKQDKNFGKAYNINNLTLDLEYDMLLTMDSDIVFLENVDYFNIIKSIYDNIDNIGVISFNQLEANCHVMGLLNIKRELNGHTYLWNEASKGIAGGCVLVDFNFWKKINGYRIMGVYAGEDSYLFLDAKKHGKFYALNTDVCIKHLEENNDDYQKWKLNTCLRDTDGEEKPNLDKQIKESEDFWKNSA